MLKAGREIRATQQQGKNSPLRKRFWKDVHVKQVPEGYNVLLDSRPVRAPTKAVLTIPTSKAHLAYAIALEWDLLVSAQQALKNHNIPLTSITSRAQDIIEQETQGRSKIREDIIKNLMRYLETDTLLCWPSGRTALHLEKEDQTSESLRQIQIRTAKPIITFLTSSLWPGIELRPILDENSILPAQQPEMTKSVIHGWMSGLPAYELAALERGGLASKSLLVAARLLVEWSEEFKELHSKSEKRFGIEDAAEACSLEVRWQTGMWGEVEDTHDLEKEDLKCQLGSITMIISGNK